MMSEHRVLWTLTREDFDVEKVESLARETSITVVIPAKDEAATIGSVIEAVKTRPGIVDQLIVVNDHSSDDTAAIAAHHGARIVRLDGSSGRGNALRAGLEVASSELVVFLDANVTNTTPNYVLQLVQPLLEKPEIQLVKAYYVRPLNGMPTGGGRVNELAARPILSLLFPGLGEIRQPLAGETAGRRSIFERISLESNYSVEIAILIDAVQLYGIQSLAQVDLGIRRHRNRPIEELRPMAAEVLQAALQRYGVALPPEDH
jgi:glucosyl-3-phosphoglycerate synthase